MLAICILKVLDAPLARTLAILTEVILVVFLSLSSNYQNSTLKGSNCLLSSLLFMIIQTVQAGDHHGGYTAHISTWLMQ
jgi:hypothetical protein